MSIQDDSDDAALERVSAELDRSLKRCRKLLFDCRSQLAANCNLPELLDEDEGQLAGIVSSA